MTLAQTRSEIVARHRERHPEFVEAARIVASALTRGELVRADQCSRCGKACKTEASHFEYDKPLWVEWLCRKCHAIKDRALECPNGHPYEEGSYSTCSKGRRSCNVCREARAIRTEQRRLARNRGEHA